MSLTDESSTHNPSSCNDLCNDASNSNDDTLFERKREFIFLLFLTENFDAYGAPQSTGIAIARIRFQIENV
jgi:hypothetical protein